MKTLVIVIDNGAAGDYSIAAHFDDGSPGWRTTPVAEGTIAAGLTKGPYPAWPAGQDLTQARILELVQTQDRPSPAFRTIGEHLWSLIGGSAIGPSVIAQWTAHRKRRQDDANEGIRTILDVRPPELRALPWELMVQDNLPLFASPLNPVLRGPLSPAAAPPSTGRLLRVLVLVGSTADQEAVKADEEVEHLEDAARVFRREIDLHVERQLTRDDFARVYREFKPHVLHFTGHGDRVRQAGGPTLPSLVFQDGAGTRWDWTTQQIQGTLAVEPPRLAFLNACRTGTQDARQIVGALSEEFLKAGTLGVVAMQADIAGAAAAQIAGATYAALARGEPLDAALAAARYALRESAGQVDRRDWCLPALEVAVPVAEILPSRLQLPDDLRTKLQVTPEFIDSQAFVDRRPLRRAVDPLANDGGGKDLLVVDGPAAAGKTSMLLWFLEGCAWCGHAIKYVDLKKGRPGFLEVIDLIVQAEVNPYSGIRQQLKGDFTRVRQLAEIVRNAAPAPGGTPDNPVDALFTAFRRALVDAAGTETLVIALDHLGSMQPDAFRNYLRPFLLDRVVQREMQPVRFVLACDDEDFRELKLATLQPAQRVTVRNFPAGEFPALYREYLLSRNVPRARIPPPPMNPAREFPPRMLPQIYELLELGGQI